MDVYIKEQRRDQGIIDRKTDTDIYFGGIIEVEDWMGQWYLNREYVDSYKQSDNG